ncbi:unnamed protein product [Hydatigera taeniaeformis]|uniref:SPARK domain-containing protein n=1 Tax=Hydatigena taeniaeformis TaxID=6205 RepID=A0A0R3WIQ3_HYDTA|nr:unnamed protein product [Hydatigera taeniaeformis]
MVIVKPSVPGCCNIIRRTTATGTQRLVSSMTRAHLHASLWQCDCIRVRTRLLHFSSSPPCECVYVLGCLQARTLARSSRHQVLLLRGMERDRVASRPPTPGTGQLYFASGYIFALASQKGAICLPLSYLSQRRVYSLTALLWCVESFTLVISCCEAMFILRLAIEAFHLVETELSNDLPSREEKKYSNSSSFPSLALPHYVDPIIFHFGRKRPSDSGAFDARQHLFSPKRLCFDASLQIPASTLLHSVILGCDDPSTESRKRNRLCSYPTTLKRSQTTRKRIPLNGNFHNTNQGALPMSTLTYQWLVTAFWGQMLAARAWTPPKEEPLDLSCKQPKSQFVNSNVFSSIRRLVEPLEPTPTDLDAEIRRTAVEVSPRNLPLERSCLLPTFETLVNSARLFNDLRSCCLGAVDQISEPKNLCCDALNNECLAAVIDFLKSKEEERLDDLSAQPDGHVT